MVKIKLVLNIQILTQYQFFWSPLEKPTIISLTQNFTFSTYDADYLLDLFSEQLCPAAVPDGQTCNLPLNPGVYGADPFLEVTIPDIPDILVELVGAGTYYLGANVNLEDGTLYSCLFARVEVVAQINSINKQ